MQLYRPSEERKWHLQRTDSATCLATNTHLNAEVQAFIVSHEHLVPCAIGNVHVPSYMLSWLVHLAIKANDNRVHVTSSLDCRIDFHGHVDEQLEYKQVLEKLMVRCRHLSAHNIRGRRKSHPVNVRACQHRRLLLFPFSTQESSERPVNINCLAQSARH